MIVLRHASLTTVECPCSLNINIVVSCDICLLFHPMSFYRDFAKIPSVHLSSSTRFSVNSLAPGSNLEFVISNSHQRWMNWNCPIAIGIRILATYGIQTEGKGNGMQWYMRCMYTKGVLSGNWAADYIIVIFHIFDDCRLSPVCLHCAWSPLRMTTRDIKTSNDPIRGITQIFHLEKKLHHAPTRPFLLL